MSLTFNSGHNKCMYKTRRLYKWMPSYTNVEN